MSESALDSEFVDEAVASFGATAHFGDPSGEQWALEGGRGLVRRPDLAVISVSGADRLTWLTSLASQIVTDLAPGVSRELLILSPEGRVEGAVVGRLAVGLSEAGERRQGLVVLLGVQRGDGPEQVATVARKIAELRILDDERSALDAGAPILVISQFTLDGDTRKGRRPSWAHAAPGEEAEPLVDAVVADLRGRGLHVETGQFGAMMEVSLVNDGPFTVLVEASYRGFCRDSSS